MTSERSYRRPTRLRVRFWDPLARFMIRRGLTPGGETQDGSGMRVLEVRGRKTGRWYQRPVAVAAIDGRFLVGRVTKGSQPACRRRGEAAGRKSD